MPTEPSTRPSHLDLMDADGFWRQFVVTFYFDTPGDEVEGTLIGLRSEGTGPDAVPRLKLQTAEGRVFIIAAHQERLKAELVKRAPVKGDVILIKYNGDAERAAPGMNKSKLFTVTVTRPKGAQ